MSSHEYETMEDLLFEIGSEHPDARGLARRVRSVVDKEGEASKEQKTLIKRLIPELQLLRQDLVASQGSRRELHHLSSHVDQIERMLADEKERLGTELSERFEGVTNRASKRKRRGSFHTRLEDSSLKKPRQFRHRSR